MTPTLSPPLPTTAPRAGPLIPATYWADPSVYRFSVAQYQRMAEVGILTEDDRVELLEGYVVYKMPRNPPHDGTVQLATRRIGRRLPPGWDTRVQLTVVLPDGQPEPDLAVARGDETTYLHRHPTAADVGLVVEVADTSLARDQYDKARSYANAGIPAYWIVNLVDRRVEVYSRPSGPTAAPAYADVQSYSAGDAVPLTLDGVALTVPVADLLP